MNFTEFFLDNIFFFTIAFFILGVLMMLETKSSRFKNKTLTPATLTQKVNQGATLIDLRSEEDYQSGYIAGAKNIPIKLLSEKINKLKKKDKSVILYCYKGLGSEKSIATLEKAGFTQVFHLGEGISSWKKENLPLV